MNQREHYDKIMVEVEKWITKLQKNIFESLIFPIEPLNKNDIKKMLSEYGKYDLEKILEELSIDYKDRGIVLTNVDQRFYFKTSDYLKDYITIQTKNQKSLKQYYRNLGHYLLSSTCY